MRRRILTLTLVLGIWACHALPSAAQTGGPLNKLPTATTTPARVGPYVRGDRRDFKDPEFGIGVQYTPAEKGDSSFATVYVYQPKLGNGLAWTAHRAISAEAREARSTPEYHRARGAYDRFSILAEKLDTVRAGGHVLPGYLLTYMYQAGDAEVVSFYNVYVAGRTLVKIRGSFPASQVRGEQLQAFARDVAARIVQEN